MKLITLISEMRSFSADVKRRGKTIAFVPTMGYLHEGHTSLLKKGRELADVLVMSIFVNPPQFGPKEDYASYPRDFKRDLKAAEANKVDILFNPAVEEMYPEGFETYVEVKELGHRLCGISRHGHFSGVATVVVKLFNIVKPDIAIFGEKDFQQFVVIKRMVMDLNMSIGIVGMPTVREEDGLAMSSRNACLSKKERKAALCLYNAVVKGRELFEKGVKEADVILKEVRNIIKTEPLAAIDYAKICDTATLEDLAHIRESALLALAVKINKTRLIDNCILRKI